METNGIRNSPFWVLAWIGPPVRSGPAGRENSLAGGRNCNRLYGSRDAQEKSVPLGRKPPEPSSNNLPVTSHLPTTWYAPPHRCSCCSSGLHPALALAGRLALGWPASGRCRCGVGLMASCPVGAVLGRLLAGSGGASARVLVENCGPPSVGAAGLGILVGMPVFFEVGLVLLMPIVAEAARRTGRPPVLAGMPLLAGLSIVHGTLPPHPAAMLAAVQYHADLGRTILWGLASGCPPPPSPGRGWDGFSAAAGTSGKKWRRGSREPARSCRCLLRRTKKRRRSKTAKRQRKA
jgi:hypothetical protein